MTRKKYFTEEERKEARRAYKKEHNAKYYQEHKDKIAEYMAKRYQEHKDKIAERHAKYYQEHKQEIAEKKAKYREEHKAERAELQAKYRQTKEGRASILISNYKRKDKKYNRGECDLTMPWFIRNIFTKCIYCGESDWKKLGADRIDNSKGHTIENVVPACWDCNNKRQRKPFEQFYMESKMQKSLENICLTK